MIKTVIGDKSSKAASNGLRGKIEVFTDSVTVPLYGKVLDPESSAYKKNFSGNFAISRFQIALIIPKQTPGSDHPMTKEMQANFEQLLPVKLEHPER